MQCNYQAFQKPALLLIAKYEYLLFLLIETALLSIHRIYTLPPLVAEEGKLVVRLEMEREESLR